MTLNDCRMHLPRINSISLKIHESAFPFENRILSCETSVMIDLGSQGPREISFELIINGRTKIL